MRWGNLFFSFHDFDWWLIAAVFVLTAFGLSVLYSIGLGRPDSMFLDFKKQVVFFVVGLFLMFFIGRFNYVFFRSLSRPLYVFNLLLLLAVLFFGVTVRGTKGWFSFFGLSFQPVELMKLSLILLLAFFIARRTDRFKSAEFFLGSAILTVAPMILVILQPDFGSTLLLIATWLALILMSGARRSYLLILLITLCSLFFISWFGFFKDYQKERFLTFFDPARDPLYRGYNITQSIIAVGSGQWLGRGLGYGSQSQLRFLPEAQTDFIFAVIAEELGFVGAGLVIVLFLLLFYRLLKIASSSRDDFCLFTVLGVLAIFVLQFVINVGMNIGLLPVTGITLPFLSAGGSSLIVNFVLIGIVQAMARARKVGG